MSRLFERILRSAESVAVYLGKHLVGKDLASYCELATSLGLTPRDIERNPELEAPYILVNSDQSLLSVYDVQGTYQMLSADEFTAMVDNLRISMTGYMRDNGHSLTLSLERDPDRAEDELMRLAEPQIVAARRIGITTVDLIMDTMRRNAPFVAFEQNLLVIYTHTSSLTSDDLKRQVAARIDEAAKSKLPRAEFSQNPVSVLMALKDRHDNMVERLLKDFATAGTQGRPGVMIRPMTGHEAVRAVRIMVNRERTSQKFRAVLPGDKFVPHGREDAQDASDLFPPKLSYQICANNVQTPPGTEFVKTDELVHTVLSMELGPQDPQPFTKLFSSIDRRIPWRVRIDLVPGGLNLMRARAAAVSFVGMLPANRAIRDSFAYLRAEAERNAIMAMKFTVCTWANTEDEAKRRRGAIERAIQAWGSCQVTDVHGDPLKAFASTVPAFTTKNVANRLLPPLPDALAMLPLQRPATPWPTNGSLILHADGKIYPVQLGGSLQDTWIELTSATPGSGKSVFANRQNNALVHAPGNTRLPLQTIIEVGSSAVGYIDQLRDGLPEHRKNEAIYMRLQNDPRFAVNTFDTQLGLNFPTAREMDFHVDLLTLFCTNPTGEDYTAPAGCPGLLRMLVELAYAARAGNKAISYEPMVDHRVDQALIDTGARATREEAWWKTATWYEVRDLLFAAGDVEAASLAQRQGVPVLPDFASFLSNEAVKQLFGTAQANGEPLIDYVRRCLTVAVQAYPVLAGRTQFALSSESRVVGIDLNDVIGGKTPDGYLRTSVMYMFAWQLATKNYFLIEETMRGLVPPLYEEYHAKRIADIADELKSIIMDECHNFGPAPVMPENVEKVGREGRKWGVRISMISQYLSDFPEKLLDAATAVYVMRGGNKGDADILVKHFEVSNEVIRQLDQRCKGPSAEGSNFLALFKTKVGFVAQILTNTVGARELWAFTTTKKDVALRARLYAALGPYTARKILAEKFPAGSAVRLIEHMQQGSTEEDGDESVISRLAKRLIAEHNAADLAQLEA
ncbi:conjugal transfer protein TraU [Achromobacter insuavis]|uniref:conjugal transfer protein TraU n=1 Tax=Achromobacter insuavis TaxID=1287735 RepID=UPI001F1487B7|nr:conjugal transfer protein TraU [Achromobacter insuavis]